MGDFPSAKPLFDQALATDRKAVGEDHPYYATDRNNLALVSDAQGDYAAAEPLYRGAAEICRSVFGDEHPDVATSLNNQALLYVATHREAMQLFDQVATIDDRIIGQLFSIGSERQRLACLAMIQEHLHQFLSQVVRSSPNSASLLQTGLQLVLRRRAIGAEALAIQRDAVLGGRYPALEGKLRELVGLRMQIAQKTLAGPGPEGRDTHRRVLEA